MHHFIQLLLRKVEVERDALKQIRYYVVGKGCHLGEGKALQLIVGDCVDGLDDWLDVVHHVEVRDVCAVELPELAGLLVGEPAARTVKLFA